jgi:hypothetical protein
MDLNLFLASLVKEGKASMSDKLPNGVQIIERRLQSAQRANEPMPTADELARDIYRELDPNEERRSQSAIWH